MENAGSRIERGYGQNVFNFMGRVLRNLVGGVFRISIKRKTLKRGKWGPTI